MENWEEEFDKKCGTTQTNENDFLKVVNINTVKSFIRTEIDKAREEGYADKRLEILEADKTINDLIRQSTLKEVIEMIEGMKRLDAYNTVPSNLEANGWNQALDTLKERIEKMKE